MFDEFIHVVKISMNLGIHITLSLVKEKRKILCKDKSINENFVN